MKKKYTINFVESSSPITEPVTKFGGQPVWIEKSEWAVSRSTGKPMMFIGQIQLDKEVFGEIESKMAYIFIEDEEAMSITWEADGGDNAVIIQPNGNNPPSINTTTGPTLYSGVVDGLRNLPENQIPCEFRANLQIGEDPDSDAEIEENLLDKAMMEIKIGGTPIFLQSEQFPNNDKEDWNLLLQMDSGSVPFDINFGDAGVGYAFISNDGKTGKFLWQCC